MLPGKRGNAGRPAAGHRQSSQPVLGVARTGCPRRALPPEFGLWNGVSKRFARWLRVGVWRWVFAELLQNADLYAKPV